MTADEWAPDDPSIPGHEPFLRRISRRPDCYVVDAVTKEFTIKEAALVFDGDGMSVHSDVIREALDVPRSEVVADWGTHTAIEFPADAARARGEGGIQRSIDPDDPKLGEAHALIQGKSGPGKPPKPERKAIRQSIVDNCRILDEDPAHPRRGDDG